MAALNDPSPESAPAETVAPAPPLPSETKTARCRCCREPMYSSAVRCNACGQFQNWRRFFDLSSVFLSLLIALIAVSSAVLPALTETFSPGSKLVIRSHHCERDAISLLVENRGTKPGFVGTVVMSIFREGMAFEQKDARPPDVLHYGISEVLAADPLTSRIVPPRSSVQIRFLFDPDFPKRARDEFPDWTGGKAQEFSHFRNRLDNCSIRVGFQVSLLNYEALLPITEDVISQENEEKNPNDGKRHGKGNSFYRYYRVIKDGKHLADDPPDKPGDSSLSKPSALPPSSVPGETSGARATPTENPEAEIRPELIPSGTARPHFPTN